MTRSRARLWVVACHFAGLFGLGCCFGLGASIAHAAPAAQIPPAPPPVTAPAAPTPPAPAPTVAPAARPTGPRVALLELSLEGEGAAPALAMELQDGFVIGLVRSGVDVLDAADVEKKLAIAPELKGCSSSPCLKRTGELTGARFALRVKVALTGNSYRMTARLFSTEGAAPAALPIATLSRSCDVCTVNEARDAMIKLADGMRARIEAEAASLAPPPAPPPQRSSNLVPLLVFATGIAAIAGGAGLIAAADANGKNRAAVGGTFLGAGLTTSVAALVTLLRSPQEPAAAPAKVAARPFTWHF